MDPRPPCMMKWDTKLAGYVPVTDPVEASNLAKRCIYRSVDHPALTLEDRATLLLSALATCETDGERRATVARALLAESATPVHQDLRGVELVDQEALKRWAIEMSQRSRGG